MFTKLFAVTLLGTTALIITLFPDQNPVTASPQQSKTNPKIEIVFVLDTTSSMEGLLSAAKEKIWSIASTMASAQPAPEIKIGLVAFRDRGDQYITQVADLNSDLDYIYTNLMRYRAEGGGDMPESVNQALYDAVHHISWSSDSDTYKVIFLVGDAPPHMDYPNEMKFPDIIRSAQQKNIIINTIQCGQQQATRPYWQQIAQLGKGDFLHVNQQGNAIAIATPYDEELAALSSELDDTRHYYGSAEQKAASKEKVAAAEKLREDASIASRARRALFNATESGQKNFIGANDIIEDLRQGRVELESLTEESLPASIQAIAPEERPSFIQKTKDKRNEITASIQQLAKKRQDYIKEELKNIPDVQTSLDNQIFETIKQQAKEKGINYLADEPVY